MGCLAMVRWKYRKATGVLSYLFSHLFARLACVQLCAKIVLAASVYHY